MIFRHAWGRGRHDDCYCTPRAKRATHLIEGSEEERVVIEGLSDDLAELCINGEEALDVGLGVLALRLGVLLQALQRLHAERLRVALQTVQHRPQTVVDARQKVVHATQVWRGRERGGRPIGGRTLLLVVPEHELALGLERLLVALDEHLVDLLPQLVVRAAVQVPLRAPRLLLDAHLRLRPASATGVTREQGKGRARTFFM